MLEVLTHSQDQVLCTILNTNSIVFFPSNEYKNNIVIHLIKNRMDQINSKEILSGDKSCKKIIAILIPTLATIAIFNELIKSSIPNVVIKDLSKESKKIELMSKDEWINEQHNIDLITITPENFRQTITKQILEVSSFDTIIIDEIHTCFGKHPLASVALLINKDPITPLSPLIVGVTSCALFCKKNQLKERLEMLEKTTQCKVYCSQDSIFDLQTIIPRPENLICRYYDNNESTGNNKLKTKILLEKSHGTYVTSLFNNLYDYNPYISLSPRDNPIPYIINAIERILQGDVLHTAYKYIRTNKLNINDNNIKELKLPNPSRIFSNYTHFNDVQSYLLQIMRVLEECGILASIGTFKIFMKPKKLYYQLLTNNTNKSNFIGKPILRNGQSLCNLSGLLNPDSVIKNEDKKKFHVDELFREEQIKIQNTTENSKTIKDLNQIKKNIDSLKLINNGPFINQDFYDADFLISCSLLDVFIVLVAQLNSDICKVTANNFLKNYSQSVTNDKKLVSKNDIKINSNNIFAKNNIYSKSVTIVKDDIHEEDIEIDINSFDIYSNILFDNNGKIIIPRLFNNKKYLIFRESMSHAVVFQILQLYSSRMFDATVTLGSSGIYDGILRSLNDDDNDDDNDGINKNPSSIDCLSNNTYNYIRPSVLSLQSAIYDACVSIQESINSQDLKKYMENEIQLNESDITHRTKIMPLEKIVEDTNVKLNKKSFESAAYNKIISNNSYLIQKNRQVNSLITSNNSNANSSSKNKRNISEVDVLNESKILTTKNLKMHNEKTKENLSTEILTKINKMVVLINKFPEQYVYIEQCCKSDQFSFLLNKDDLPYLRLQKELDIFKSTINLPLELFISKIPFSVTDDDMIRILSEFGTIIYWNRGKSGIDNQMLKNFGVVQFKSSLSALKCVLILEKIKFSKESEIIIVNAGSKQNDILNLFSNELRENILQEELNEISEKISFIYHKINERINYDSCSEILQGFETSSSAIIRSEVCNYKKKESIFEESLFVNADIMITDIDNTAKSRSKSFDISNDKTIRNLINVEELNNLEEETEFLLSTKLQLISSKVIAFLKLWSFFDVNSTENTNDTIGVRFDNNKYQLLKNWSCIAFGKSKPIIEGVSFVFNIFNHDFYDDDMKMNDMLIGSKSNSSFNDSIEIYPCSLSGNLNNIEINQIISGFGNGVSNLLFAVDNSGVDIDSVKSSDVIINFDVPNPSKNYFLRRSKALIKNSLLITLVPYGKAGDEIIDEINTFVQQDLALLNENKSSKKDKIDVFDSKENCSLEDLFRYIIKLNKNRSKLSSLELSSIPSVNTCVLSSSITTSKTALDLSSTSSIIIEESGLKENAVEDGEIFEEKEDLNLSNGGKNKKLKIEKNISTIFPPVLESKVELNKVEILLQTFTAEEIYLITKYTGGNKLDNVFCSDYLLNICAQLDCVHVPKFEYHAVDENQIICYAALGSPITPHMRCQVGPVGSNLIEANGLLSLICIRMILNCKEFSQMITPMNRNSNILVPVNTVCQNILHRFDSESVEIIVKTVPDLLHSSNVQILTTIPKIIEKKSVILANSIANNEILMSNFPLLRTNLLNMKGIHNILPSTPSSSDSDSDSDSGFNNDADKESDNASEIQNNLKKIREDQLNIENEIELNGSILLYFYGVRAICENGIDSCIHTCGGCIEQYKGLNSIGIAVPNEIPKDITDFSTIFSLRELDGLELKFQLLGSHYVNCVDLNNMQRFHRGSYCWESDGILSENIHKVKDPKIEDEFVDYMDGCYDSSQSNQTIHESRINWAASSNGSYYIIFPLPDTVNLLPTTFEDSIITDNQLCGCINSNLNCSNCNNSSQKCNSSLYNHFSTQKWSDYIKKCADESQVLIHNILVLQKKNKSLKPEYYSPFTNKIYKKEDLKDKIYIRGSGDLYTSMEDDEEGPRNLDSVMKMVKVNRNDSLFPSDIDMKVNNDIDNNNLDKDKDNNNNNLDIEIDNNNIDKDNLDKHNDNDNIDNDNLDKDKLADMEVDDIRILTDKSSVFIRPDGKIEEDISEDRYPVTYSEYYKFKNPDWAEKIDQMRAIPHELIRSQHLLSRLTLTPVLGPIKDLPAVNRRNSSNKPDDIADSDNSIQLDPSSSLPSNNIEDKSNTNDGNNSRIHHHVRALYLLVETIRPLGKSKYYILGLLAPSVVARLQAMLVAIEGRSYIIDLIMKYDNDNNDDHTKNMNFKLIFDDVNDVQDNTIYIPPAPLMLEALTPRLAKEAIYSERLELLGDSLLKLITTVELYRKYPDENEGFLTINRSSIISNLHLFESAKDRNLEKYIHCNVVSSGKQNLQIRPSGMTLQSALLKNSLWNKNIGFGCIGPSLKRKIKKNFSLNSNTETVHEYIVMEEDDDDNLRLDSQHIKDKKEIEESLYFEKYFYSINKYEKFIIKPKIISDMIEAIIGAFFVSGGINAGIAVIKAIGSWPKKELEIEKAIFNKYQLIIPDKFPINLRKYVELNYNKENDNNLVEETINKSSVQTAINIIANKIGYKFKDKNLLLESLTHSSIKTRRNNQRLEFLGDAVLDFAVVSTLFKYQPHSSQGDLSNQKSISTNNRRLSILGIKLELYNYIEVASSHVYDSLLELREQCQNIDITTMDSSLFRDNLSTCAIKTIADTMEALIGAVYIDSNGSIEEIYKIIEYCKILPQINFEEKK